MLILLNLIKYQELILLLMKGNNCKCFYMLICEDIWKENVKMGRLVIVICIKSCGLQLCEGVFLMIINIIIIFIFMFIVITYSNTFLLSINTTFILSS